MKLTEKFARKTIEEVAPLVEYLSELKCDLESYEIVFGKIPNGKLMGYYSNPKLFFLKNNFREGNKDYFKISIGHELMHNAQFSVFPELIEKEKNIENQIKYSFLDTKITNPLEKLIEGDANLIKRELNKRYFKNSKLKKFGISLLPTKNRKRTEYDLWEEILRKKFGKDRKSINELYTAPIKELEKIFDQSKTL